MSETILVHTLLEVLGKPEAHVQKAIETFVTTLEKDERYTLTKKQIASTKAQEDTDLFSTFAELEFETTKMEHVTDFCFKFMPSSIEVLKPKSLVFSDSQLTHFLGDLQTRLHSVDMAAKQAKMEKDNLRQNVSSLLENYLRVLLGAKERDAKTLSTLTGVSQDHIEDFLDAMIDKEIVDLKEGVYFLKDAGHSQTS